MKEVKGLLERFRAVNDSSSTDSEKGMEENIVASSLSWVAVSLDSIFGVISQG